MSGFTGGFGGFGNIRKAPSGTNMRQGIRKTRSLRNRSFSGFKRNGSGNVRYPTKRA